MTKTYSLPLEVVELIASLANDYGSQRKVIETAVYALAGEPLPDAAPKRKVRAEPDEPVHSVATVHTQQVSAPSNPRESFAERKRRNLVADAVAAKTCPDCGDRLPWCGCETQAADVRRACQDAGLSPVEA